MAGPAPGRPLMPVAAEPCKARSSTGACQMEGTATSIPTAAVPESVHTPAPITAPMPSAARLHAPNTFFSRWPGSSVSSIRRSTLLVRHSCELKKLLPYWLLFILAVLVWWDRHSCLSAMGGSPWPERRYPSVGTSWLGWSHALQRRVFFDELLAPVVREADFDLAVGAFAVHRQDRALTELGVAHRAAQRIAGVVPVSLRVGRVRLLPCTATSGAARAAPAPSPAQWIRRRALFCEGLIVPVVAIASGNLDRRAFAQALNQRRRHFQQEARGLGFITFARRPGAPPQRSQQVEVGLGPRHPHVAQPALFFDVGVGIKRTAVGKQTLLQPYQENSVELRALGAVQRHQRDRSRGIVVVGVADQGGAVEEVFHRLAPRLALGGGLDQLAQVFQPPVGLRGVLLFQPVFVATLAQNVLQRFGERLCCQRCLERKHQFAERAQPLHPQLLQRVPQR